MGLLPGQERCYYERVGCQKVLSSMLSGMPTVALAICLLVVWRL